MARRSREDRGTMIDDTLTALSLEPKKVVTKLNRKSLKPLEQ